MHLTREETQIQRGGVIFWPALYFKTASVLEQTGPAGILTNLH